MLPQSLMSQLQGIDIICLDHFSTPTTEGASVVIPTAVPGVESGGSVVRMDGEGIALAQPINNGYPAQEEILRQLLQKVQP
jgi:formylmethanofuran dehydrogenase subunit B